jgi:hypothetical protein
MPWWHEMASFPRGIYVEERWLSIMGMFQAELSSLVRPVAQVRCSAPACVISKPFSCNKNVAVMAFRPLYFALYWNVVGV